MKFTIKNEVQKCLRIDGVGERNNVAYKVVCQYAAQRYTEYRNQLRRKLIADIKAGKDVQSSAIDKFAEDYLAVYLSAGQQSDSRDRMQLCIILRSFLHTKKLNLDGSDSLEFYCNFWQTFKEYHDKTMKDIKNDAKRMDKLQEIDSRRRLQRLGTEK
ncbi:uncharacterized protein LOC127712966 [Mytilus californianus]|uniref:uncharacterized protein LOC127712966 n=1 Tax=Mytilus californianus TaxID=6549 RepID=UPI002245DAD2|nr:uncharacterized protein LOC127712966 [Mytilus californianus]